MLTAPLFIVVCADPYKSLWKGKDYSVIDACLAAEYLILSAMEFGIGSCWIGAFNEQEVKRILSIPNHIKVVGIITLGYPDEKPRRYHRNPNEIVFYEEFGKKYHFKCTDHQNFAD